MAKFNQTENEAKTVANEAEVKVTATQESEQKGQSQIDLVLEAAEALASRSDAGNKDEEQKSTAKTKTAQMYLVRGDEYTVNGNTYYEYVVPVAFCGQIKKVHFKAADRDGYDQLETLFNEGAKKLLFKYVENVQKDDNGNERKWTSYMAVFEDADGFEWEVPVKPVRSSDKSLIENYVRYNVFIASKKND